MGKSYKYYKPRKISNLRKAMHINNITFTSYVNRMMRIALSMFTWENLPQGMNERFLEYTLYLYGQAALCQREDEGFINTQCTTSSKLNLYHLPTRMHCFAIGGINFDAQTYFGGELIPGFKPTDYAVLVLNSQDLTPTNNMVEEFAYRLTEVQRTLDVNVKLHKMPYFVSMDDKQRLSFQNMMQQIDENVWAVYGNKNNLNLTQVQSVRTDTPYIIDKLTEYKTNIWNEFLTYLGVNNLHEKKERLVAQEAVTNNEVINLNLQSFLAPRQKAADLFNKLHSLTGDRAVTVKLRSDLQNIVKQAESIINDYNIDLSNADKENEATNE